MVRDGIPYVLIPLVLAIAFAVAGWWVVAGGAAVLMAFMAFFFRDPSRTVPDEDGVVVSAADGRVTRIDTSPEGVTVSVFLSPLDVHINRSPVKGVIESISYIKGKKLPATSSGASFVNERNSLLIRADRFDVTCTQIAGILARRIVCWPSTGDTLDRGQKFGLIKFSSRTDLLLPAGIDIAVKVGDRVRGGETVIARFAGNDGEDLTNRTTSD